VRKIIAIAGIVGLSLCWAVMPAGAGNSPHFDSTPTSGPPGTVIHASDNNFNCDSPGASVQVKLIANESVIAEGDTTVGADSKWAVDLTVPSNAAAGEDTLTATCSGEEFQVFYANNSFTVTAVVATTTTTEPATTTTTTTVPVVITPATTPTTMAPPVPTAPAAAPVVASPALTG
jgi:hypothetical protein